MIPVAQSESRSLQSLIEKAGFTLADFCTSKLKQNFWYVETAFFYRLLIDPDNGTSLGRLEIEIRDPAAD